MATKINDDSMALEIDGRVLATAEFRDHAAADVTAHGPSRATPAACSPGTRPSRPWCSRSGSPLASATMIRS